MCLFMCEEHTDVNDPLLDSWLACMPVIPKAELHIWALVILKHSHHDRLKVGEEKRRKKSVRKAAKKRIRYICLPKCHSSQLPPFSKSD